MKRVIFLCVLEVMVITLCAQDVSLDKKLGAENAALIEQEMGFYRHDSLTHLINSVGQKLVSRLHSNPFEFKFFLVDSAEPNAFALPGGYVYVTRGILAILLTEDELAGVMAHEIIHVAQRHSVKQMRKGVLPSILKIPGNVINKITGTGIGNILNVPIGITSGAIVANYSRGHESESDAYGIQLAASAGYKPEALADALERLSRSIELLTGEAETRNYFSDHPFTPSRISAIRKSAPQFKPVNPSPITPSREAFLQRFSGLCFGQNPEQGIFKDSLFIQPDLEFAWLAPPGWHTFNKPVAVAAFTAKGDAVLTLRIADSKKSPKEIGEEVKVKASESRNVTLTTAGDTIVNGLNAYRVRLKSTDKKMPVQMEIVWVAFEGNVFQLTGICVPTLEGAMKKSLYSFRSVLPREKAWVKLYTLQVVAARKDENLSQISDRAENKLNLDLMAVLNGIKQDTALREGAAVKIVRVSQYTTQGN